MLTNKEPVQLRVHLEDWDGNRTAIVVNEFKISNEQHGYRIFYNNFKVIKKRHWVKKNPNLKKRTSRKKLFKYKDSN